MDQTLIKLHQLGFSEYEAKAYIALLKVNPVTGYELSKNSGVPRSMIYQTLQRLTDKGAALAIMGQPIKYLPAKPQELFQGFRLQYNTLVEDVQQELAHLDNSVDFSYFWNIKGYQSIIAKLKNIVTEAKDTLYCSAFSEELSQIELELLQAYERGVKIELLARGSVNLAINNIYPYRERSAEDKTPGRWLTVIADAQEVLVGEGLQDIDCIALWTKNSSLVTVCLRYIKYEIFVAQQFSQINSWTE